MAAGGIYYQGQIVRKPGAYSTVDADGLASPGIGALGIVAILGTCEGMIPGTAVVHGRDLPRIRRLADDNDARRLEKTSWLRQSAMQYKSKIPFGPCSSISLKRHRIPRSCSVMPTFA